jgi:hypothetical protein
MSVTWTVPWSEDGVSVDVHGEADLNYVAIASGQTWQTGYRPTSITVDAESDLSSLRFVITDTNGDIILLADGISGENTFDLSFGDYDIAQLLITGPFSESGYVIVHNVTMEGVPALINFWGNFVGCSEFAS